MAASDSLPAGYPLPGSSPVIGHLAPAPIRRRRTGEGLPSSRRHLPHVPRPLRREVLRGCASRLFTPSMAFALTAGARLLLVPTMRWVCSRRGRLRFMLRTAWSLPLKGFRHRAPARPVSRPDRRSATGPPGSYPDRTFTGRRRRACLRTDQIILHRPSTSGRTPSLIEATARATSRSHPRADATRMSTSAGGGAAAIRIAPAPTRRRGCTQRERGRRRNSATWAIC